jgi:hypothetical protein
MMETFDEVSLRNGRRYRSKIRQNKTGFVLHAIADADLIIGVWDCQEKRYVMKSPRTGEWVPEKYNAELMKFEPDEDTGYEKQATETKNGE